MVYYATNKSSCSFLCIRFIVVNLHVLQHKVRISYNLDMLGLIPKLRSRGSLKVGGQHGNEADHNYETVDLAVGRSQ